MNVNEVNLSTVYYLKSKRLYKYIGVKFGRVYVCYNYRYDHHIFPTISLGDWLTDYLNRGNLFPERIRVNFGVALLHLQLDTKEQILKTKVWLRYVCNPTGIYARIFVFVMNFQFHL